MVVPPAPPLMDDAGSGTAPIDSVVSAMPTQPNIVSWDSASYNSSLAQAMGMPAVGLTDDAATPWSEELLTDYYKGRGFFAKMGKTSTKEDAARDWSTLHEQPCNADGYPEGEVPYPSTCMGWCLADPLLEQWFCKALHRRLYALVEPTVRRVTGNPKAKVPAVVAMHLVFCIQSDDRLFYFRIGEAWDNHGRHRADFYGDELHPCNDYPAPVIGMFLSLQYATFVRQENLSEPFGDAEVGVKSMSYGLEVAGIFKTCEWVHIRLLAE